MNPARDRYTVMLAFTGGALGVAAGITQVLVGSKLGGWSGGKSDPVPLGALTIVLSSVAITAAQVLRRNPDPTGGRRAALGAAMAVPAVVCFTTVGRLWWVPGTLLVLSATLLIAGAPAAAARAVAHAWLAVLTALLGACLTIAAATANPTMLAFGLASGLAIASAPWISGRSRPVALALLLLGSVPFAAATWWTAITPAIAMVALGTGVAAIRGHTRGTARPMRPQHPEPVSAHPTNGR